MTRTRASEKESRPKPTGTFFSRSIDRGRTSSFFAPSSSSSPPAVQRKCGPCEAKEKEEDSAPERDIQAKLTVGAPDDPFEREADAVADRVVRRMAAGAVRGSDVPELGGVSTSRDLQAKGTESSPPPARVSEAAAAVGRGGRPFSIAERSLFEPHFGRDLSHVRIHDRGAAGSAAHSIGARAYTVGSHIAFAPGQYGVGPTSGRRLVAHELAHVMQQGRPPRSRPMICHSTYSWT